MEYPDRNILLTAVWKKAAGDAAYTKAPTAQQTHRDSRKHSRGEQSVKQALELDRILHCHCCHQLMPHLCHDLFYPGLRVTVQITRKQKKVFIKAAAEFRPLRFAARASFSLFCLNKTTTPCEIVLRVHGQWPQHPEPSSAL